MIGNKRGNVYVLLLISILILALFLVFTRETPKTNYERNPVGEAMTESDISMRKALYNGLKESMEHGLSELDGAWFCDKVFPPDVVEVVHSITNHSIDAAQEFLSIYRQQGYYENFTNVSIDVELDPSQWESLDEEFLRAHATDFLSGIESEELVTIKDNTNEYMLRTRAWYLYKNIVRWLRDTEAGGLIEILKPRMLTTKPCLAENSWCECPEEDPGQFPDGRLFPEELRKAMYMYWEDLNIVTVEEELEDRANKWFSDQGTTISCKAEVNVDHSHLVNIEQFDYRKGPTNLGVDDKSQFDGQVIVVGGTCMACEAPPDFPQCRNNFLGLPDLSQPTSTHEGIPCIEARAPAGLDSRYARFEYFGLDRLLLIEIVMTCTDQIGIMEGNRNLIKPTIVFLLRSQIENDCDPRVRPINTLDLCWNPTEELVGPDCVFIEPGAQPPADPDGVSCRLCNRVIRDSGGNIIGCADLGPEFPTSNPDFMGNDDCAAVLEACLANL